MASSKIDVLRDAMGKIRVIKNLKADFTNEVIARLSWWVTLVTSFIAGLSWLASEDTLPSVTCQHAIVMVIDWWHLSSKFARLPRWMASAVLPDATCPKALYWRQMTEISHPFVLLIVLSRNLANVAVKLHCVDILRGTCLHLCSKLQCRRPKFSTDAKSLPFQFISFF